MAEKHGSAGVASAHAQRFLVLDTWRGIAALTVAFGHFKTNGWLSSLPLASASYRLVDFFFVLSGFVIAHSSARRVSLGPREASRFLVRRFFRLWPLHVFILMLFFAYQVAVAAANLLGIVEKPVAFSGSFSLRWLPHNLLLVQAWETTPYNTWNEPAWSISTEVFAYLTFVLVFSCLGSFAYWACAALFVGTFCLAASSPDVMTATYTWAIVRCLVGFHAGVAVYWLWSTVKSATVPAATWVEVSAVAALLAAVIYLPLRFGVFVVPVFCICVFVFAFEQGRISRGLRQGPLVWLGDRSYSIYLGHAFLLTAVYAGAALLGRLGKLESGKTGLLAPAIVSDLLIVLFLSATVAFSALTYRFVEDPGRRAGRLVRM
jgi:peptidoglycan/LPS O-acetylase OafA/YrhL